MSDFILDSDPFIPTGVEATPVQVGLLILDETLPVDSLPLLAEQQQPTPEDLGQACIESPLPTEEAVVKLEDAGFTVILPEEPNV